MGADTAGEMTDNTLHLMVARELKEDDRMPADEMKDELYQCLVAGSETSGTTLSWWVKYMTNHPDVWIKLWKHLLEAPGCADRQPTFEDINPVTLTYLEGVVHEALRLGRIVSALARTVAEDIVIFGKHVPKVTNLVFPTIAVWEDKSNPVFAPPSTSAFPGLSPDAEDTSMVKRDESLSALRTDGAVRKIRLWATGTGKVFDLERWLDDDEELSPNAGPFLCPPRPTREAASERVLPYSCASSTRRSSLISRRT